MKNGQSNLRVEAGNLATMVGSWSSQFTEHVFDLAKLPLNVFFKQYRRIPSPPPYASAHLALLCNLIWTIKYRAQNDTLLAKYEKWIQKQLLEQSKPYGIGPVLELPRLNINEITQKDWREVYEGFPVIITGMLKDSIAVRKWSLDYLKKHFGRTKVFVYNKGTKDGTVYREGSSFIPIAELVDQIRTGGLKYGAATSNLFGENKELLQHLNLDKIFNFFGRKGLRVEAFIGGPQNASPFHCALGGNFFCQIHGEKKWVLVSPTHSMWMYPQMGYDRSENGFYVRSPIITDRQDKIRSRYPLYNYIPKYVAHLKPGDVLYNPSWWWHEVTNLGETIGVPIRVLTRIDTNIAFTLRTLTSSGLSTRIIGGILREIRDTGKSEDLLLDDKYFLEPDMIEKKKRNKGNPDKEPKRRNQRSA